MVCCLRQQPSSQSIYAAENFRKVLNVGIVLNVIYYNGVCKSLLMGYTGMMQNGPLLSDDRLALYDAGHRFEHTPFLLVLLRALPFSSKQLQLRVLQVSRCGSVPRAFIVE